MYIIYQDLYALGVQDGIAASGRKKERQSSASRPGAAREILRHQLLPARRYCGKRPPERC